MRIVKIEDYRGFEIFFDTDRAKFTSILSINNTKESDSFLAVKKNIDDFKKENKDFVPFWIIANPNSQWKKGRIFVTGVRKDGRYVGDEDGKKVQISDHDLNEYILEIPENESIMDALSSLKNKLDEYKIHINALRNELLSKLKVVTLKDYKNQQL